MRVLVEGWADVRHSFAVVLRGILGAWLREPGRAWSFRAVPHFGAWPVTVDDDDPVVAASVARAAAERPFDRVLRVAFPFDPTRPRDGARLHLFLTSEDGTLAPTSFAAGGLEALVEGCREGSIVPLVPSRWSAGPLVRLGIERFDVVPHGVDAGVVAGAVPDRARFGIPDGAFAFLSVGAMSANKGIDALLRAFRAVRRERAHAVLVLKGLASIYPSRQLVHQAFGRLVASRRLDDGEAAPLGASIAFLDADLTEAEMASLYASCDAYVAPYSAEGFCIPALEAAAAGLVVLASAGGPTDEFLPPAEEGSLRIRTRLLRGADGKARLIVDEGDLAACMRRAIDDAALRACAHAAGPLVASRFDWKAIGDRAWAAVVEAGC